MKTQHLWNPLPFEVSTQYNLGDGPQMYALLPEKITSFDNEVIFNHMREYLVAAVLNHRNIVHYDHNREEVRKEIIKEI